MGPRDQRRTWRYGGTAVKPLLRKSEDMGMSTPRLSHSRWMDWRPSGQIIGHSQEDEPTKPSKLGSEGFVGAGSVGLPNIQLKSPSTENVVHGEERAVPWAEWKAVT